jgi:hypothetical protein
MKAVQGGRTSGDGGEQQRTLLSNKIIFWRRGLSWLKTVQWLHIVM